jgi:(aminoalkyl)phosphonate N-acetyltransferase
MQSSDSLTIRPASLNDCPTIYTFLCDLEEMRLNATAFEDVFRRNLNDETIRYRVAEIDRKVIGFISCHIQYLLHHTGRVGEIQELYVLPEYRNQRIGRQLIAHLEELAQREEFVNLEVTTNQRRMDTIRFYEQTGFKASHRKLVKVIG